jgi:hypothetical protein
MDVERSNTGQIVTYILFNYVSLIMLIFIFICYFYFQLCLTYFTNSNLVDILLLILNEIKYDIWL